MESLSEFGLLAHGNDITSQKGQIYTILRNFQISFWREARYLAKSEFLHGYPFRSSYTVVQEKKKNCSLNPKQIFKARF